MRTGQDEKKSVLRPMTSGLSPIRLATVNK